VLIACSISQQIAQITTCIDASAVLDARFGCLFLRLLRLKLHHTKFFFALALPMFVQAVRIVTMRVCQQPVSTFSAGVEVHTNLLTPTVAMGTAIKHPMPHRVKPSFVIFDIQAL